MLMHSQLNFTEFERILLRGLCLEHTYYNKSEPEISEKGQTAYAINGMEMMKIPNVPEKHDKPKIERCATHQLPPVIPNLILVLFFPFIIPASELESGRITPSLLYPLC
jgi:hypothetical protein